MYMPFVNLNQTCPPKSLFFANMCQSKEQDQGLLEIISMSVLPLGQKTTQETNTTKTHPQLVSRKKVITSGLKKSLNQL